MKRIAISVCFLLGALAFVYAHGGFEHVQGFLTTVETNTLTIRTAKGDVQVKINAKTQITKNDRAATAADLLPGLRVIAEVPEGDKSKTAQSVKIGVAEQTKPAPAKPSPAKKK